MNADVLLAIFRSSIDLEVFFLEELLWCPASPATVNMQKGDLGLVSRLDRLRNMEIDISELPPDNGRRSYDELASSDKDHFRTVLRGLSAPGSDILRCYNMFTNDDAMAVSNFLTNSKPISLTHLSLDHICFSAVSSTLDLLQYLPSLKHLELVLASLDYAEVGDTPSRTHRLILLTFTLSSELEAHQTNGTPQQTDLCLVSLT
ncbi:hypothetical protein BDV98DRAFT_373954 [Pterulicium gracile]|uniref:Uncharacterized protein n=1 Tax=Pterulicium gracile TaxID=1884261 RepID=A0A5C3Q5I5_9AGAR|nr:hypothetical protein BDV98DRAFT_373954 [Pterula gracilis]